MPESLKVPAAKTEAKVHQTSSEDRTPEVRPHPSDLHAQLLYRQKTIGNQAVQRLIRSGSLHEPPKKNLARQRAELDREAELDHEYDHSPPPVPERHSQKNSQTSSPRATIASSHLPRITTLPGGAHSSSPSTPIHAKRNDGALHIQRHWYNVGIPGTNYQFDPSLEGIKTAATVVKDTAEEGFHAIVHEIESLVDDGMAWLNEKWTALQGFATSALDSAAKSLSGIIGFLTSPLSFLADAITNFDAQSINKAWATFSGMVTTVSNGFKAMTDGLCFSRSTTYGNPSTDSPLPP